MCCKSKRCAGCPGTDWTAFSWRWRSPASLADYTAGTIARRFTDNDRVMVTPGCSCLWIVGAGDTGKDTSGNLNPSAAYLPIASIGALNYRQTGSGLEWKVTIRRWLTDFLWDPLDPRFGYGWGWIDTFGADCTPANVWGGNSGYGWNGLGWGWGWGYGYGWGWGWAWGTGQIVERSYSLAGQFDCRGGVNLFLPDTQDGIVPDQWPAKIELNRVQL